jgi:hypothetical protein
MTKLPCGALFNIKTDSYSYSTIEVLDRTTSFSQIVSPDYISGERYGETLMITIKNTSIWPLIRILEQYAKEHEIKEIISG